MVISSLVGATWSYPGLQWRVPGSRGMMRDREQLRAALRVALIKDRRGEETFDEIFDQFFKLVKVGAGDTGHGHGHGHKDLSDEGALEDFTLSEEPSDTPQQGHEHGKPVDIRDFFDPDDLAQQYNLHQEANKIDLAAMTDEIVISKDNQGIQGEGRRVQIETDRMHNAGMPGEISQRSGTKVDADLSVVQQEMLLGWLNDVEGESQAGTEDDAAALCRRMTGVLAGLPEALKAHLEALMALENKVVEGVESQTVTEVDRIGEHERMELEESLRRLARSLHGGLTHKRNVSSRGRIDSGRTMRRNMRFDGIPFAPVTVRRAEDKPRLVVLTDVSLSVRATARFTLHLVHGLQNLFGQVRTFAFVSNLVEITTCSRITRWSRRWGWYSAVTCWTSTPTPTMARRSGRSTRTSALRSTGAPQWSSWVMGGATATMRTWQRSRRSPAGRGRRSG